MFEGPKPTKTVNVVWNHLKKEEIDKLPNDKNGVYIFVSELDEIYNLPMYVGKAKPFSERYSNHLSQDKEVNPELYNFLVNEDWVIYFAEMDLNDYEGGEEYLFQSYDPEYNKNEPSLEKCVKINLPPEIL
ncbi:MAG: hypothetical protein MJ232_00300 [archaeon]|nr:hypothetical protein [Bacilli bacterium]MCQ2976443.1 hypothetical protein [archaeon]